jgi:hypothetical protein
LEDVAEDADNDPEKNLNFRDENDDLLDGEDLNDLLFI